ncbi:TetR/AcrR family transcriptional regulator [Psychromonas arctica]|uniref:TetR/AcrR family transcriptional regulator n=1 Tax=Psychromonas arctica TaxID=168275 RepID=A0ABU9HCT0_9GAMM
MSASNTIQTPTYNTRSKADIVLDAARTVFLSYGFSDATTDMIQKKAGVSKSTVYAHYKNKEALFIAVIESECKNYAKQIRKIQFSPGKLKETLTAMAHEYLNVVLSPTALSLHKIIISEGTRFPSLANTFYNEGPQVIISIVSEILNNAKKRQEVTFTEITLNEAAKVFIHLVRSEPQLSNLMHPNTPPTKDEINRWVVVSVNSFLLAFEKNNA